MLAVRHGVHRREIVVGRGSTATTNVGVPTNVGIAYKCWIHRDTHPVLQRRSAPIAAGSLSVALLLVLHGCACLYETRPGDQQHRSVERTVEESPMDKRYARQ